MIKNFETVKAQLSELASVINSFKSEAVQLRIIELVLGAPQESESPDESGAASPSHRGAPRKRTAKAGPAVPPKKSEKRKVGSGTGAYATLHQLAATTFFDKPRTINDIIAHCKVTLARHFKANEFSGKLGRMVRNDQLTRVKNADKQYEYKKP